MRLSTGLAAWGHSLGFTAPSSHSIRVYHETWPPLDSPGTSYLHQPCSIPSCSLLFLIPAPPHGWALSTRVGPSFLNSQYLGFPIWSMVGNSQLLNEWMAYSYWNLSLFNLEGIYLEILYLEIKNKYIPYSNIPAHKYVITIFWWPRFPYMGAMTCLPKAASVWRKHNHSAPTLPPPNQSLEWKRENSDFSSVLCQEWTTSLLMKNVFISTSLSSFRWLPRKSSWLSPTPKDQFLSLCAVISQGHKYGFSESTEQPSLQDNGSEFTPPFLCGFCLQDTGNWVMICRPLERTSPSLHLQGDRRESRQALPRCATEDY